MATYQTDNLDLTYGDQGETDWHVWMNSNIQKLDFDFQGALAFDTSTKAVTAKIGTIWVGNSGAETLISGSGTEYLCVSGQCNPSLTEDDALIVLPRAGRIQNLRIYLPVAPGTGQERIFTVLVNGVASDLTCTVSGTSKEAQDVTNIIELGAGARVCLEAAVSSTAAASRVFYGMEFEQYGVDTGS